MPRRCGGWLWPPAESNSRVSLHMMRPRSGVIRPATMLTIELLPDPEGPNSAVTPSGASNFAAMEKPPSCFSTSTSSISTPVQPRAGAAREPLGGDEGDERDDDRDHHKPGRRRVRVGDLRIGV